MLVVVVVGFEHQGRQLHPGDRVWLPLGAVQDRQGKGYVRPDLSVQHRDPVPFAGCP